MHHYFPVDFACVISVYFGYGDAPGVNATDVLCCGVKYVHMSHGQGLYKADLPSGH